MKDTKDLGPCRCGCGRKADMPKHGISRSCYSSMRLWSNVKSPKERAQYMNKLLVRQNRLVLIDEKEVVIGTSPFDWRKGVPASNVTSILAGNLHRGQRGSIR